MSDTSFFTYHDSTAAPGFMRSPGPSAIARPRWLVAGIGWDGATTNRPGARFGPGAIRRASQMLCDGTHPLWGVSPLGEIADIGDLPLPNASLTGMRAALAPLADALIAQHHMVWLGGDHSITLPLLQAYHRHYRRPLAVVHFDAHCDTWTDHGGNEPSGHGTWVHEAVRDGIVDPTLFVQLGIRSPAAPATSNYIADRGGMIFTSRDLRGRESAEGLGPIVRRIRERLATAPASPLYLTLDIDCLDPAFAPGTGTPEPGGLSSNQVLTLLEELHDLPWIGMDLCEVAPPYDHAQLTSNAAAYFAWTYLCGQMAAQR
ncbi:MAG: agmatinase [Proteobacteria bacterium]|nr:agmatinase [Pseudomonadota bacterium]